MNGRPAVRLDGVSFRYPGGNAGVFDVGLAIEPGELVVCIGPSGCGKTTLLRLIAGFLRADAGRVELGGRDMTSASVRSRQCGVVFQSYALFPHMNVRANVAYPLARPRRRAARARAPRRRDAGAGRARGVLGTAAGRALRRPAAAGGARPGARVRTRARCCSTSRCRRSTRRRGCRCATRSGASRSGRTSRRCSSPTTRTRRCRSPTASPCCATAGWSRWPRRRRSTTVPPTRFVAGFVGRANLIDGDVVAADVVDTPLGRLVVPAQPRPPGTRVRLLLRPERVVPCAGPGGENVFAAAVVHDRFFGANREVEFAVGGGSLKIETTVRGRHRARPRTARSGAVPVQPLKESSMQAKPWLVAAAAVLFSAGAAAQTVLDSPELYAGEKALYEAAKKEGMVVSFDTGPTWANWAAQFAAFKKRYPEVEIVYNDLGSAATVVALEKARNRPQADTAYYFAASAVDAVAKGLVAPFKPVNFDKLPAVFREPDGTLVHDPLADRRVRRQHQARQERAAVVGGPLEARVQELDRLPRSALDRRRPGAHLRRQLRRRRRHEQRAAGPRLPRQAAQGRQRAARARHHARTRSSSRARSRSGFPTRTTGSRPNTPTGSATPWRS